nr:MAG TPA: hypothetical protein [Caudoviricetes sp.]
MQIQVVLICLCMKLSPNSRQTLRGIGRAIPHPTGIYIPVSIRLYRFIISIPVRYRLMSVWRINQKKRS